MYPYALIYALRVVFTVAVVEAIRASPASLAYGNNDVMGKYKREKWVHGYILALGGVGW